MSWLVVLLACGGGPTSAPAPAPPPAARPAPAAPRGVALPVTRTTQQGRYDVRLATEPSPVPLGELFTMVATLTTRDGAPIEDGEVRLDALMPHHGHGMMTDPVDLPGVCEAQGDDDEVCTHPGGVYRTEGFKFHMAGAWTVTVAVQGPRGPDTTSVAVEVE